MSSPSLARLVGDPDRFLREQFGRSPVHIRSTQSDVFDDVLTLSDVDRIIADTALRAPSFRLVRDGTTLPVASVTRRVRIGSRSVDDLIDVAAVHAVFAQGASIVLQGLHRSWEPVGRLCRILETELTHPVQANAYLTPPVAQGLDLHADPHDVFAVQTHGSKRWVVHPPDGGSVWDIQLSRGDVLYLPAGTRHAAQTIDQPSLHLTIGIRPIRWRAVLRATVDELLDRGEWDTPLPAGWATDVGTHRAAAARHLEALADEIRSGADGGPGHVLEDLADGFWSGRVPERRGGLMDLLELDDLDDDTRLRVRPYLSVRLEDGEQGRLILRLADRRLDLPAELREVLERLLATPRFAPSELDEFIDEPSRFVLCRRLVREGLLTFDRPARTA